MPKLSEVVGGTKTKFTVNELYVDGSLLRYGPSD